MQTSSQESKQRVAESEKLEKISHELLERLRPGSSSGLCVGKIATLCRSLVGVPLLIVAVGFHFGNFLAQVLPESNQVRVVRPDEFDII